MENTPVLENALNTIVGMLNVSTSASRISAVTMGQRRSMAAPTMKGAEETFALCK